MPAPGPSLRPRSRRITHRVERWLRCTERCLPPRRGPRSRRRAAEDARASDPRRAVRRAARCVCARGDRAAGARRPRRADLRDGRRGQLQQRVGGDGHPGRRDQGAPEARRARGLSHRRLRCQRRGVGGRPRRHPGQGRRRGRRPLRDVGGRRSVDRRRQGSDARDEPEDLGLRVQLGQLRAVHAGAGSSVPAQAAPPDLGAGGGVHAGRGHRLSDAARLAAQRGRPGRAGPGVGRRRRARIDGDPDRARRRGRGRSRWSRATRRTSSARSSARSA